MIRIWRLILSFSLHFASGHEAICNGLFVTLWNNALKDFKGEELLLGQNERPKLLYFPEASPPEINDTERVKTLIGHFMQVDVTGRIFRTVESRIKVGTVASHNAAGLLSKDFLPNSLEIDILKKIVGSITTLLNSMNFSVKNPIVQLVYFDDSLKMMEALNAGTIHITTLRMPHFGLNPLPIGKFERPLRETVLMPSSVIGLKLFIVVKKEFYAELKSNPRNFSSTIFLATKKGKKSFLTVPLTAGILREHLLASHSDFELREVNFETIFKEIHKTGLPALLFYPYNNNYIEEYDLKVFNSEVIFDYGSVLRRIDNDSRCSHIEDQIFLGYEGVYTEQRIA